MNRDQNIQRLKNESFDLLIIGGGITGAGIALDATLRGLKTALVEKHDFAFGTSSRSTKLIHGGLRYLKQLEFGLVKEVGSERAVVHRLAPHLVIPEKMLLPLYEKRGLGSVLTSVGLKLYDWLAGVKPEDQRRMLTRNQTLKHEPLLNSNDVKGGAIYAEYRTDDARLTIEIVKTSHRNGAVVSNYLEVKEFLYSDEKISGAVVADTVSGEKFEIKSKVVVNATGPWVDDLREADQSKKGKTLRLTKGIHIVVPREKLPIQQAIYFDVEDGRMIFAIPRGRTTYIGTTDTNYTGSIDHVVASKEDVLYLLRAVNQTFINTNLSITDVESSWAGLRPLIHEEGKSASELSRKDEIFESGSGLISIAGGKLTGYRKMAERVVDKVIEERFEDTNSFRACSTDRVQLCQSSFNNYEEVRKYMAAVAFELRPFGLEEESFYLVSNYGKQASAILESLYRYPHPTPAISLALSELEFTLKCEMVIKPEDFLIRRTGYLYFNRPRLELILSPVLEKMLNANPRLISDAKKEMELLIKDAAHFT